MRTVFHLVLSGVVVILGKMLFPGIVFDNLLAAVIVTGIIGILDAFVRPILEQTKEEMEALIIGFWVLALNIVLIPLLAALMASFSMERVVWAGIFILFLSLANWIVAALDTDSFAATITP